jgi:hypothetical protein
LQSKAGTFSMFSQTKIELPLLGLSLAIPRQYAESIIAQQMEKGVALIPAEAAATQEAMDALKKSHWQWVLETCEKLRECFGHEAVASYFSSSVYIQPSIKLDDLAREGEEFGPTVNGRLDRLSGLLKTLPVIPEPPAGDLLTAILHPKIAGKIWRQFELGQYVQAIESTIAELAEMVKGATAGSINGTGPDLMWKAFHEEEGPLADKDAPLQERKGLCYMLCGFVARYQGIPSYAKITVGEAGRILAMASHLMFMIEGRSMPQTEPAEESEQTS